MSKAQKMTIRFLNKSIMITIILATFIAGLAVDVQGCFYLFAFVLVTGIVIGAIPYVLATLITWLVASTK